MASWRRRGGPWRVPSPSSPSIPFASPASIARYSPGDGRHNSSSRGRKLFNNSVLQMHLLDTAPTRILLSRANIAGNRSSKSGHRIGCTLLHSALSIDRAAAADAIHGSLESLFHAPRTEDRQVALLTLTACASGRSPNPRDATVVVPLPSADRQDAHKFTPHFRRPQTGRFPILTTSKHSRSAIPDQWAIPACASTLPTRPPPLVRRTYQPPLCTGLLCMFNLVECIFPTTSKCAGHQTPTGV